MDLWSELYVRFRVKIVSANHRQQLMWVVVVCSFSLTSLGVRMYLISVRTYAVYSRKNQHRTLANGAVGLCACATSGLNTFSRKTDALLLTSWNCEINATYYSICEILRCLSAAVLQSMIVIFLRDPAVSILIIWLSDYFKQAKIS